MDLLESILRTCHAEKYVSNFKDNGIDAFTLKILDEEDLKIIGIEEADVRELILKHISNLQIPSEKKVTTVVDKQYAYLVLNTMSMQLNKHYANLTYALKREDIDLCDIRLSTAVDCLQHCFTSLEDRMSEFETKVFKTKNKNKRKKIQVLLPTLVITSLALFAFTRYFSYLKK